MVLSNRRLKRDKEIISNMPEATIMHIHFTDKRFTPELEYNPLKGVYYIQLNNLNPHVNLNQEARTVEHMMA